MDARTGKERLLSTGEGGSGACDRESASGGSDAAEAHAAAEDTSIAAAGVAEAATPLSTAVIVIYAMAANFGDSLIGLTDALLITTYIDTSDVSPAMLALSNFVVGFIGVYSVLMAGNLSDKFRSRWGRRKPLVAVALPVFLVGSLARYCGPAIFTSSDTSNTAAVWYLVTYTMQIVAGNALGVLRAGWSVELTHDLTQRTRLYTWATFFGLLGLVVGVVIVGVFNSMPLIGIVLFLVMCTSHILLLNKVPENTPTTKVVSVPMVPNISSVLYNDEYRQYLKSYTLAIVINTTPAAILLVLRYAMGLDADESASVFVIAVSVFVVFSMAALRPVQLGTKRWGVWATIKIGLAVAATSLLAGLPLSLGGPYVFAFAVTPGLGFAASVLNIVDSVITGAMVDYDELSTKKRRETSYAAVKWLPNRFITVSGSAVPLALAAIFGFQPAEEDDADDTDVSAGAKTMLLLWPTVLVPALLVFAIWLLRNMRLTNDVHTTVVRRVKERDENNLSLEELEDPVTGSVPIPPPEYSLDPHAILQSEVADAAHPGAADAFAQLTEDESRARAAYAATATGDADLASKAGVVADDVFLVSAAEETDVDEEGLPRADAAKLWLLRFYFAKTFNLLGDSSTREMLLQHYYIRLSAYTILLAVGCMVSVTTLACADVLGSYLVVSVTMFLTIAFAYWVAQFKGFRMLRRMHRDKAATSSSESVPTLVNTVEQVVKLMQDDRADSVLLRRARYWQVDRKHAERRLLVEMSVATCFMAFAAGMVLGLSECSVNQL